MKERKIITKKTKMQSVIEIEGVPVNFLIQDYSNRLFVIVTENGRIGSLMSVNKINTPINNNSDFNEDSFNPDGQEVSTEDNDDSFLDKGESVDVKVILGPRDNMFEQVCAGRVLDTIYALRNGKEIRPVLVGFGIKKSRFDEDDFAAQQAWIQKICNGIHRTVVGN